MSKETKRIVIVGATSVIAQKCAKIWAEQYKLEIFLVGRDSEKLKSVANNLMLFNPAHKIKIICLDVFTPTKIQSKSREICSASKIDIVLIAHGYLPDQKEYEKKSVKISEALNINGISPILFAEEFANNMVTNGFGVIAIISSVAGDRGRRSNYIYGSAKALINCYAEGLNHRLANSGLKVILIKPGPTNTPMAAEKGEGFINLTPVEVVAQGVVNSIKANGFEVYLPKRWRMIMAIIKILPNFIFKRLQL